MRKRGDSWEAGTIWEMLWTVVTEADILVTICRFLGHVVLIALPFVLSGLLP